MSVVICTVSQSSAMLLEEPFQVVFLGSSFTAVIRMFYFPRQHEKGGACKEQVLAHVLMISLAAAGRQVSSGAVGRVNTGSCMLLVC